MLKRILATSEAGLLLIIRSAFGVLTFFGGSHQDVQTGHTVSNFFNPDTLLEIATNASFFAIMAVGMTMVIVSAGIDLSIGSIYALCGVSMAVDPEGAVYPWSATRRNSFLSRLSCASGLGCSAD